MKIRKIAAALLSALIFATSVASPSTLPSLSITCEAASKLKAPLLSGSRRTVNSITLKWSAVSGADGYLVYRYSSSSKKYKLIKTTTDTECTMTGLVSGTTYKFKLAAYVNKNGKKVAQNYSSVIKLATSTLIAPRNIKATSTDDAVTLSWDKVYNAAAYKVYMYDSATGKYKSYKTVKGTKCVVDNLKKSTTYKFKIRTLAKNGSSYKSQKISSAISVKTKADKTVTLNTKDFTVYDSNGKKHKLSDYAGKPIIVNIWATWCGPCVNELPHFNKFYKEYGDEIQFMMVNCESRSDQEYVEYFVDYLDYDFPVFYDFDDSASLAYSEGYIPLTIVIDADGNLVTTHTGSMSESQLLDLIKKVN